MRILIIGAGAVGGYFGARLTACGRDVTFLVREQRAAQLRANGLQITSPHGYLSVTPQLISAEELKASLPFDLIIVSTKAYALDAAMDDFAPAVGPETAILPLLNGLAHLDKLIARFGDELVLGGSTRIVADLDEQGHIHSMEKLHDISFGKRDKTITPRVQAIDAQLRGCGFDLMLAPDILAAMWQKWVFLASLGAVTCLFGGSIGQVVAAFGGSELALAILKEAESIATANGYAIAPKFLDAVTHRLTDPASTLTASMYRDLHKGAAVEADHILGDLIARGSAHNLASPLLQAAFVRLSVYSATRKS